MNPFKDQFANERFPIEDYSKLRKSATNLDAVSIPYTPVSAPAWSKHNQDLGPKPARFSKLNKWDKNRSAIQTVVKWAVLAAGTASVAAPAIMQLPH